MKPGIASRGSPTVSSIGRWCPGATPSSSRRNWVNGERIAPELKAPRPSAAGIG
jgi:hypothetical protein